MVSDRYQSVWPDYVFQRIKLMNRSCGVSHDHILRALRVFKLVDPTTSVWWWQMWCQYPVCQFVNPYICLYVCLSVTICICICICLYVCVSLYLSVCIACPCFDLSVWPSLLSLCLSVCLPIFLSNFFRGVTALSFFSLHCTKEGPTQSGIAVIGWARPSLFPFKTPDFLPEFHQRAAPPRFSRSSVFCLSAFN